MKLLLLAGAYPHSAYPTAGVFNARCAEALLPFCSTLDVVVPRPYAPRILRLLSHRWSVYSQIPKSEIRQGVHIERPPYIQIPRWGGAFTKDLGSFLSVRRRVLRMHRRVKYDAILSFDLGGTGGLAWRLGRALGIPACGWAFGDDVRVPRSSGRGRALARCLRRLNVVFYQSAELKSIAAGVLQVPLTDLDPRQHVVLSHGIPSPPELDRNEVRGRIRAELDVTENDVVVMSVGRLVREKGIFELLDALETSLKREGRITAVLVGSTKGFDETPTIRQRIAQSPLLTRRVRILPMCAPEKVWEYLCAADIFVFTSYREGMPNSLLEAMAMEVPSLAFAIPPVLEIDAGTGGVALVPPFDATALAGELVRLSAEPAVRRRIAAAGRARILERFMVTKNMATAFQHVRAARAAE